MVSMIKWFSINGYAKKMILFLHIRCSTYLVEQLSSKIHAFSWFKKRQEVEKGNLVFLEEELILGNVLKIVPKENYFRKPGSKLNIVIFYIFVNCQRACLEE